MAYRVTPVRWCCHTARIVAAAKPETTQRQGPAERLVVLDQLPGLGVRR